MDAHIEPQVITLQLSNDGKLLKSVPAQYSVGRDTSGRVATVSSRMTNEDIDECWRVLDKEHMPANMRRHLGDELMGYAIEAAKTELELFESAKREMQAKLEHLTLKVLESEESLLKEFDKFDQLQAHRAKAEADQPSKAAQEVDQIAAMLYAEGCTTPTLLAKKLSELRVQVAESRLELQKFDGRTLASEDAAEQAAQRGENLDDEALQKQWALWRQEQTDMMRNANLAHIQLSQENSRLRRLLLSKTGADTGSQRMHSADIDRERVADGLTEMRLHTKAAHAEIDRLTTEMEHLRTTTASDIRSPSRGISTPMRKLITPPLGKKVVSPVASSTKEVGERKALLAIIANHKKEWDRELNSIRGQIIGLRKALADTLDSHPRG